MKYEAIDEYRRQFSVRKMCSALGVKESNYYRWRGIQERQQENCWQEKLLVMKIEEVFSENRRTYGYRKMQRALAKSGIEISVYRVRKMMRENGFYPETCTKYKPYHNGKQSGQFSPNLLKQNFRTENPDKVWVGDITYIKTTLGWVYLAAVIDLYNREVIGYAVGKQIDTELVKRALGNAIKG
jgi:putative transposase